MGQSKTAEVPRRSFSCVTSGVSRRPVCAGRRWACFLPFKDGDDSKRRGWLDGSYQRKITTRDETLELEVPRDREGTLQTASSSGTSAPRRRWY